LPLGQLPLNAPCAPEGPTLKLTHAEGVGPNGAHTFTVNDATWPPWTLDCARVTLTHSAGGELAAMRTAPAESAEPPDAEEDPPDAEEDPPDAEEDPPDAGEEAAADAEDDVAAADDESDGDGEGDGDAEATGRYSHCAPGGRAKEVSDAKAAPPPGQATTARTTPPAVATASRRSLRGRWGRAVRRRRRCRRRRRSNRRSRRRRGRRGCDRACSDAAIVPVVRVLAVYSACTLSSPSCVITTEVSRPEPVVLPREVTATFTTRAPPGEPGRAEQVDRDHQASSCPQWRPPVSKLIGYAQCVQR